MLVFCVYSYSQVYTCKNELVNSANISCDLNNTELAAIDYHLFNSKRYAIHGADCCRTLKVKSEK